MGIVGAVPRVRPGDFDHGEHDENVYELNSKGRTHGSAPTKKGGDVEHEACNA